MAVPEGFMISIASGKSLLRFSIRSRFPSAFLLSTIPGTVDRICAPGANTSVDINP